MARRCRIVVRVIREVFENVDEALRGSFAVVAELVEQ